MLIFLVMTLVCFVLALWFTKEAFLEQNTASYLICAYAWAGMVGNAFVYLST